MNKNNFGWNRKRVKKVAKVYQTKVGSKIIFQLSLDQVAFIFPDGFLFYIHKK